VAKWCRLMRAYAGRQQRRLDEDVMAAAMTWSEPSRDVVLPRQRAFNLLTYSAPIRCKGFMGKRRVRCDMNVVELAPCVPSSAIPCALRTEPWAASPNKASVGASFVPPVTSPPNPA
jgi:hypothetical protein